MKANDSTALGTGATDGGRCESGAEKVRVTMERIVAQEWAEPRRIGANGSPRMGAHGGLCGPLRSDPGPSER